MDQNCPCGLDAPYDTCCAPFHRGDADAPTAERLMRARYSAYVKGEVDFILASIHADQREEHDADTVKQWSAESEWLGLEIVGTRDGGEDDEEGLVEFIAQYRNEKGEKVDHHELAKFGREEGKWVFLDGNPVAPKTYVRAEPRIGRNDPCPCGSGKKYKKCCAVTVAE